MIPTMLQKKLHAPDGVVGGGGGGDGAVGSCLELVRPYWSTEYYVKRSNYVFVDQPVYSEPSIGTFEGNVDSVGCTATSI
jgi:hypothetical protein